MGELLVGYQVHHKDHDKGNNEPDNLEQLIGEEHTRGHMQSPERIRTSADWLTRNNEKMQELAAAAKRGEYLGQARTRKMMKGKKQRECAYCGKAFILKDTDKNGTRYCQFTCAQRGSKQERGIRSLNVSLDCPTCDITFVPTNPTQYCCSDKCRKVQTELKRKANKQLRNCIKCGEEFETIKSSKKKYCTVDCRKSK